MDVTLNDLNLLGDSIRKKREIIDDIKMELKTLNEDLELVENEFIQKLKDNGMTKYFIPGVGTAFITTRFTYKVPKEPMERDAFFSYLKEKGIYEDMITVHSQTLNSWTKTEMEAAVESGVTDFRVPGLGDPSMYENLNIRKN